MYPGLTQTRQPQNRLYWQSCQKPTTQMEAKKVFNLLIAFLDPFLKKVELSSTKNHFYFVS